MNKITITICESSVRVTISEDRAKPASRKKKPELVKGFILKDWYSDE